MFVLYVYVFFPDHLSYIFFLTNEFYEFVILLVISALKGNVFSHFHFLPLFAF